MKLHYFARLRRTLYASITASLILLFVAACGGTATTSTTPTAANTTPIKIGFSVSLAGDFSADGKALLMGYNLWRDAVNKRGGLLGRQVQLVYYNDSSDPQQVTTNYQKLIGSDHVDLLLGPFSTLLTVQAAPVAQRYGYALIEGAGTGNKVFNSGFTTLFGASAPSQVYLGAFAQYILSLSQDQRPKTVAYATVDNPFAIPQVDYAKKVFSDGGLQTAFDLPQPYPEEATDVSAIAKQIIHSGADVVVLGTVGVTDSVSFIKTFKQQHYNPKAIVATSGPDEGKSFTDAVGVDTAEGIFTPQAGWYPGIGTYQNSQFVQDYLAKFGGTDQDINSGTVQGYSAAQVLEQAVNKIQSVDNAKLIQELRAGSFNSLQGPVKFDAKGQNTEGVLILFQWQNGKLTPVYPANQAQASPEYPKKQWPA
ncbi:MAG TPA: amino acid ABC transporter substrate-binding protein [Ktedonobacteraceae bacterium]